MGFFDRFNPNKEGPGVEKDALPKKGILVFFEVYMRKFYKLIQLNLIHFLFSIPAILISQFVMGSALKIFFKKEEYDLLIWLTLSFFAIAVPLISVGPFQSGFSYVLRNFSREQHSFVWHDYLTVSRKNFKQSLIVSLINIIVVSVASISISWYLASSDKNLFMSIAVGVQSLLLLIFTIMQIYIYQMMVTFQLKIKDIYKNALILSMAKFLPNFLIILLCFAIAFFLNFNMIIGLISLPIFSLSITGYITNFYANSVIKKYMMSNSSESDENN